MSGPVAMDGNAVYRCESCDTAEVHEWDDDGLPCWLCGATLAPRGQKPRPQKPHDDDLDDGEAIGYAAAWQAFAQPGWDEYEPITWDS
jgi:hypothetical protein